MRSIMYTDWRALTTAVAGYVPGVVWAGRQTNDAPPVNKYWARHSIQTIDAPQKSLAVNVGGPDKRRFEVYGLIAVQIFAPLNVADSSSVAEKLCEIVVASYRNARQCNITFRNVRSSEVGPDTTYNRFNVIADFEYSQIA